MVARIHLTVIHRLAGHAAALLALGVLLGLGGAAPALAGSANDNFQVSATIADICVVTADDLDFGAYDPTAGSAHAATTTLEVTCTPGTDYDIALDEGSGAGATIASRLMTQGGDTLTYSLFQDSGHTSLWGDTLGVNTVGDTGDGTAQSFTVYGRIPAGQYQPAGTYLDTVTVTVEY
jgi:spore coat protein U-like protein